jgi:hypothetical protein
MSEITLNAAEVQALTGYAVATKQLKVLHARGFVRAFISRKGEVVLERTHYEAVTKGEAPAVTRQDKRANLSFLKAA